MTVGTDQGGATGPAREYAHALLELAEEAGLAEQVGSELAGLADVVAGDAALAEFLASPVLPARRKQEVLDRCLGGRMSDLTTGLLGVLVHRRRGRLLHLVSRAYHDLLDIRSGRVHVQVTAALPLDDDQREQLRADLASALKAKPEIEVIVDENLLGGLRLTVADRLVDASVRGLLDRLRADLAAARKTK